MNWRLFSQRISPNGSWSYEENIFPDSESEVSCGGFRGQPHSTGKCGTEVSQWNSALWLLAIHSSLALPSFIDKMRGSSKPSSSSQVHNLPTPGSPPWLTPPDSEGHCSSDGFKCTSMKLQPRFACNFFSDFHISPQQVFRSQPKSSNHNCPFIPSIESQSFAVKWVSGNSQTDPMYSEHITCPV